MEGGSAALASLGLLWLAHCEPAAAAQAVDAAHAAAAHALVSATAEGAHGGANEVVGAVANAEEDFWLNMARYARFAVGVAVGFVYMIFKPLAQLFKRPLTAVGAIVGLLASFKLTQFIIESMLGLNDPMTY